MTGPGAGVSAQLGIAPEAVYGIYVPPTRFTEFESETLLWDAKRTVGAGLYAGGLVSRASQRATTTATVKGDIVTPVYAKGMGLYLGLIFGTMGITPTQVGTTGAYTQTHPLGSVQGQSASIQVGRPTTDGVVHPYSILGAKCIKAVFVAKVNEPLRLTLTLDAKDQVESNALVTAVYQSANPAFFWNQGVFEMGVLGAEALVEGVREFQLTIDRSLKIDNYYLDGTGRKSAPVENDMVKITGSLQTDFLSKAAFADVYAADTPQSIIVPFTGPLIGAATPASLTLSIPHARFDSEPPSVTGPDILQPKMTFQGLFDDTHVAVSCAYVSADVTL